MAPRLNKRQQREQEELEALAALEKAQKAAVEPGNDSADQIDPTVEEPPKPAKTSLSTGFAALTVNQDEEPEEESEEEEVEQPQQKKSQAKKSRRKKKPAATPATATPSESSTTPKTGQSKGKGKGKAPAAPSEPSKASDDFDAILQQMSSKYPELKKAATVTLQSAAKRDFWKLLSVEPTYLDGDEEMRRFFGSKVVDSAEAGSKKGGRGSRRTAHGSSSTTSRYHLVKPPDTWAHIMRSNQGGVAMEAISEEELLRKSTTFREEKWWTFTHSQSYKKSELRFLSAVAVGDPNAFAEILRESPWHIDTLLQLSEVFRQQDDYSHATELVERGILAFERAFAPSFNITSGLHRLDFERIENRPFFLAMHRQVLQLERRGCMRAAFEHARLLYSLDPSVDPHGALLHLDYLAPRSGMNDWLLKLWDVWENVDSEESTGQGVPRLNPKFLPGMPYAKALAMWNLENQAGDKAHEKSTEALIEAVLTFPSVVPVVADKAGILLPAEVRGLPSMRIEPGWIPSDPAASAIHLLSHLYAHRSVSIWKQPTHVEWMQKTISKIPLSQLGGGEKPKTMKPRALLSGSLAFFAQGPTLDLFRHVIITENRSLIGFFSPSMVNDTTMHAYDPVPPASSVTNYDDAYFGQEMKRAFQREQHARARQMMQRVVQQHRARGGVLPGDIDDADLADPEVQRMLLQRIVEAHGGGAGPEINPPRQPGGMPGGFEDDDEPEDEEDEAEEEGQAGQGGGILQTLWNGLWGGPPAADEEDEED